MTLNHWVEGSIPSEVTKRVRTKDDFVAQLVEQMTLNHWVEGSIPSEVTKRVRTKDDFVAQLVEQMTLNHWVEGSIPSEVTKVKSMTKLFGESLSRCKSGERLFFFRLLAISCKKSNFAS